MTKSKRKDELACLTAGRKLTRYKLKIDCIDLHEVDVPLRLRALDPAKVDQLAESMSDIGLQHPIAVWVYNDGQNVDLVAGAHRLAAAKKLGWTHIDCICADDMSTIDRQLWEIDENLMRAELSPSEHADHLVRRKELWGRRDTDQSLASIKGPGQPKGFAAETAAATGMSKSAVNLAISRAKAIPADVRAIIKGTKLDKGVYLDSLKGMKPDDQRKHVEADLAAPPKPKIPADIRAIIKYTKLDTGTYLDSLKGMEPDDQREKVKADLAEPSVQQDAEIRAFNRANAARGKALLDVQLTWRRASAEDRRRIKAWILEQETPADDDVVDDRAAEILGGTA